MIFDPHEQAEALASELRTKGFAATVYNKTGGHRDHPCIQVGSGRWRLIDVTEFVYVAPDDDGEWWFWRSTMNPFNLEPIAPALEVSTAAEIIGLSVAAITGAGIRVL